MVRAGEVSQVNCTHTTLETKSPERITWLKDGVNIFYADERNGTVVKTLLMSMQLNKTT